MKKNVEEDQSRAELSKLAWDQRYGTRQLEAAISCLSGAGQTTEAAQPESFLDLSAAKKFAGNASRTTIYHWTKRGLRYYRINRRIMFLATDIKDFITNAQNGEKQGGAK